jgi:hypothetical protein
MSLPVLEIEKINVSILYIVEITEINLVCLENVENEFTYFRNCRKYFYLFIKSKKIIFLIPKL